MLHLRAITPTDRTDEVSAVLTEHDGVTNVVVLPGTARQPAGDLVMCDLAREAANDVLGHLRDLGLEQSGSIAIENIDVSLSEVADTAEERAPGYGDDAVVWEELNLRTKLDARLTWAFVLFLALATQIAGIAALLDSPILIVGAMVLGPEFGTVAAICYGVVFGNLRRIGAAVRTLAIGFTIAIIVTFGCALASRWIGVIELDQLPDERQLTGFVYSPDRWSFIVALLAGAAGVLSITAGKSSALVGAFISVTTVPAAGNIAVALALLHMDEIRGSLIQLVLNLSGMVIAGTITLLLQRAGWSVVRKRGRRPAGHTTSG